MVQFSGSIIDIYLRDYEMVPELREGLTSYMTFYNDVRIHQALDYATPAEIYKGGIQ